MKRQSHAKESRRAFVEVIKIKTQRWLSEDLSEEDCDLIFQEIVGVSIQFVLENLEIERGGCGVPEWVSDTLIELGLLKRRLNVYKNKI